MSKMCPFVSRECKQKACMAWKEVPNRYGYCLLIEKGELTPEKIDETK